MITSLLTLSQAFDNYVHFNKRYSSKSLKDTEITIKMASGILRTSLFIAGLPRARGTEPHTHGICSTSFCLVVTWLTERTYASTDCTGRVGETIKRKGGVSQACLGKSSSFIYDIHNMVNWQLSKQDSHWPVSHDHIAGSCVNSSRWRDLFGSCPLTS